MLVNTVDIIMVKPSLMGSIVNMSQDYVASNNINLLEPIGQFGSRNLGGSDAAQPRYIFTKLPPIITKIFNPNDNKILNYLEDDGFMVEPKLMFQLFL